MTKQIPDPLREQIAEVLMRSHGMDDYEVAGAVMAAVSPEVERLRAALARVEALCDARLAEWVGAVHVDDVRSALAAGDTDAGV